MSQSTAGTARSQPTAILGVVDLLIITSLLVIGQLSHQINPLNDITHSILTYLPFYVGWLITAPVLGTYHQDTTNSPRNTALLTATAWILTVLIGGGLRATSFFPGQSPPPFLLVMTGFGLLGLISWRLTFRYLTNQYR